MTALPAGVHVLVCDGANSLLLQNMGDEKFPNLRRVDSRKIHVPASRDLGSGPAPRVHESVGTRRSAVEQPDLHDRAEEDFARDIAGEMEALAASKGLKSLIVVAPPRFLADLRRFFCDNVKALILAEINKDLTNNPIHEIEQYLQKH